VGKGNVKLQQLDQNGIYHLNSWHFSTWRFPWHQSPRQKLKFTAMRLVLGIIWSPQEW
jgi:hypothetical protein